MSRSITRRASRVLVTAVAAVCAGTCPALAADAPVALEEILVTAQKRTESVQDIGIAITAFGADQLGSGAIAAAEELARFTPNLTWNGAGGAGASVGLRGIVDINFTTGQVGSVGIVVDEVGLNSPVVNNFSLFDLDRIEVLRGPQVTLYGRSTTGGAINFITRRPVTGEAMNGRFLLTAGNFGLVESEAAVGLPVGDSAALRIAGMTTQRDGIFDNRTLGTEDSDRRRTHGRLSFAADVGDSLEVLARLHAGSQRGQSVRYKSIGLGSPDNPESPCGRRPQVGNGCADLSGFADTGDFDENFSNFPETVEDIDAAGGSVNLTWRLAAFDFASISAYEENSIERNEDTDGGPANLLDVSIVADTDQVSQEFRLTSNDTEARLRWIAGAFYLRENQDGITTVALRDFDVFISTAYDQEDTILSGYGQLDFDLADRWALTLGARFSSETKEGKGTGLAAFDDLQGRGIPPVGVLIDERVARSFADPALTAVVPFDQSWDNWGGKVGLNFRVNDDVLVYGSVSQGFKGGAINLAAGPVLADPGDAANFAAGVEPEEVLTVEVGAKTRWLDGRMQLNAAAFWNDYTDQQLFIVRDGLAALLNAASSTIKGIELEWQWRPTEAWYVTASMGYLDTEFDELVTDTGDFSGNRLLQAPEFSGAASLRREWVLGTGYIAAEAAASYVGEQYFDLPNSLSEDSHTVADARLEYAFGEESAYKLTAWSKNLGDERFCMNAADLGVQSAQCIPSEPRTYGLTFSMDFGAGTP